MHERKARMLALSDALLGAPGAFGTMDELCEMLSWRQLGIHAKPVGLLDVDSDDEHFIALFDDMVGRESLSPENRRLIVTADDIETLLSRMGLTPVQ